MIPNIRRHLFLIGVFPPSLIIFRGDLLKAVRQRMQVTACANAANDEVIDTLSRWKVDFKSIGFDRTGVNPFHDLWMIYSLYRTFRMERPCATLTYTAKPNIYATLAAWLAGVPRRVVIITGLGYGFSAGGSIKRRALNAILRALYNLALKHAHVTLFQNIDDLGDFVKLGLVDRNRAVLIAGSGINLIDFPHSPIPDSAPVFLLIARLIYDKGIGEYVAAAREVRRTYPNARFRLVGQIDSNPTAIPKAILEEWEREGLIEWPRGWQDARTELAACHVYVLPSSYREGVPRSILEALSTGRAIITTDASGCRDTVIEGVNGFLVPVRNTFSLAHAMRRFLDNPGLIRPMGDASRRLAEERFDVRRVNSRIMAALKVPPRLTTI